MAVTIWIYFMSIFMYLDAHIIFSRFIDGFLKQSFNDEYYFLGWRHRTLFNHLLVLVPVSHFVFNCFRSCYSQDLHLSIFIPFTDGFLRTDS